MIILENNFIILLIKVLIFRKIFLFLVDFKCYFSVLGKFSQGINYPDILGAITLK